MNTIHFLLLICATPLFATTAASASESVELSATRQVPLFDGSCTTEEWQAATRIELPAQAGILLMHDGDSLYVCAQGKAEDYTVVDLYIEHAETGVLHNLHASAQLGERFLSDKEWSEMDFWNLADWGGFWVPYAGTEESEEGERTQFLKGSHRELQVLRSKFAGSSWTMMITVGAIHHEGNAWAEFSYPANAVDTDSSTWLKFSFSDQ